MENNNEPEDNIDYEEIKKRAEEVQNLKEILENKYIYKIKRQREKIKKLKEFNEILKHTIFEKSKEIKLNMINRNKSIKYLNEKNKGNNSFNNSEYKTIIKNDGGGFKDDTSVEEKNNLINKTTKELNIKNS